MQVESGFISTKDGERLYFTRSVGCEAEAAGGSRSGSDSPGLSSSPRGTVLIIHGLGEHSGKYAFVVERLVNSGWEAITYDLRGHGRSGGSPGDTPSFAHLLDDLELIVSLASRNDGLQAPQSKPLFLYGHSLGGLIALRFLQKRSKSSAPFSGAIISSPWLRLAFEPPMAKLILASIARWVWPTFTQKTRIDPGKLSGDLPFLKSLPARELNSSRISARMFHVVRGESARAIAEAARVDHPLLLMHGQRDTVTSWEATRDFHASAISTDKTLHLFSECLHELHNDVDREDTLEKVSTWLMQRSSLASEPGERPH